MTSFFKSEKKGSVLHVTLTRPEAHNALHPDLIEAMTFNFKAITAKE